MSFTRAGSTPEVANDVVFTRCTDAKVMPARAPCSRTVATASSTVALSASSVTTCMTRCMPPRRSRPSRILPGWPSRS
jgi:hypothetical protein